MGIQWGLSEGKHICLFKPMLFNLGPFQRCFPASPDSHNPLATSFLFNMRSCPPIIRNKLSFILSVHLVLLLFKAKIFKRKKCMHHSKYLLSLHLCLPTSLKYGFHFKDLLFNKWLPSCHFDVFFFSSSPYSILIFLHGDAVQSSFLNFSSTIFFGVTSPYYQLRARCCARITSHSCGEKLCIKTDQLLRKMTITIIITIIVICFTNVIIRSSGRWSSELDSSAHRQESNRKAMGPWQEY